MGLPMRTRIYVAACLLAVTTSWLLLAYLAEIHAGRILEGKSLGVFGVTIYVAGFIVSLPFYALGMLCKPKSYYHVAYWTPFALAVAVAQILGVTFAP
jgi:hypothetical protein